ncbi:glycosyltransferase, partial [bacterium]|nr:glycosyltransferase [bacterium]
MNIITHLVIISAFVTGTVYTLALLLVIHALRKVHSGGSCGSVSVSVIIAAHNERSSIGNCLAALAMQDYPPDLWEVLVADDRSDDGTSEVIRRFQSVMKNLACITIESVPTGISPKKHALAEAIARAHGKIILQTDADCIPPPAWISGMSGRFEPGVDMVAGIAPYLPGRGILNSFVRHEYLWNAGLSAASAALGHATHASGRNLAFRRDVFEKLEGYGSKKSVLSGDDTLLLQRFRAHNPSSVVTMPARGTHVYTGAPGSFRPFIRQRIRHMSTGKYFDHMHIVLGIAVYGFHAILLVSLMLSCFYGVL